MTTHQLVAAPTTEPITPTEAIEFLRVDDETVDTPLITRLTVAARERAEQFTGRAFITQTWDLHLDDWWTGTLELPKAPLQSITSISYVDTNGATQPLSSADYVVDTPSGEFAEKGRVGLADGASFPMLDPVINSVTVKFVAGYGATRNQVPEGIRTGTLMYVADMYENRQSIVTGSTVAASPHGAETVLTPYKVTVA